MHTSYFANLRNVTNPLSISRVTPVWYYGPEYKTLAPYWNLMMDYKAGVITSEQYTELFNEDVLGRLNALDVWHDIRAMYGDNVTLLCYEKPGDFCHRRLVADWFKRELGQASKRTWSKGTAMLDVHNINVRNVIEHTTVEKTIKEVKAPTDESIKLYSEMKEKAYDSILMTLDASDNTLGIKAIVYRDHIEFCTWCKYILLLNGREIKGEIQIHEFEIADGDKLAVMKRIYKDASDYIANELIEYMLKDRENRHTLSLT